MSYMKTVTASQRIPLRYRCTQCGCDALAVMTVQAERSRNTANPDNSKLEYKLRKNAYKALKKRVAKTYEKEPQHWYKRIKCKCPQCGNVAIWGNDPDKKEPVSIASIVVILLLVATVIACLALKKDKLLPYFVIPEFVLILFFALVWDKISPQTRKRKEAIAKLPKESLPSYEMTLEECLLSIDRKLLEVESDYIMEKKADAAMLKAVSGSVANAQEGKE